MFWDNHNSWEEAETAWDQGAKEAEKKQPVKKLKTLPAIPGVTPETAKGLKWKSLKYMVAHDTNRAILRHFLKHPIRYGFKFLRSFAKKESYKRDGDFFLYGLPSVEAFEKKLKKALLVVGFSYCQKPLECPSGRFTDNCIRDPSHPVCRQCPIGKVLHAIPEGRAKPLIIPTVHYIGERIFEVVHSHPKEDVIFLITACEMTLKMFGDYGNMVGVKGIGVRLDGRICNTMRAFELSERGIKPGLTLFTPETEQRVLALVRKMRSSASS
ncbi:MAG: hypothetical protein JJU12_05670 [Chlamydiales bacterium]|nr:hypothetical protein [Chlamydiales bacterium]